MLMQASYHDRQHVYNWLAVANAPPPGMTPPRHPIKGAAEALRRRACGADLHGVAMAGRAKATVIGAGKRYSHEGRGLIVLSSNPPGTWSAQCRPARTWG